MYFMPGRSRQVPPASPRDGSVNRAVCAEVNTAVDKPDLA